MGDKDEKRERRGQSRDGRERMAGGAGGTSSSFVSATRNIGRSDQKNKNCSDLVCWYLRMVEEPIWKDFVLGGHLLVYWGSQSWHKFEFFLFQWHFNSQKWKVATFVESYLKTPGYTWADTYFGNQGDVNDHLYTSFMSCEWLLTFSSHFFCILRHKNSTSKKWSSKFLLRYNT